MLEKVLLISGHYFNSKTNAGFHHIANSLSKSHQVYFYSVGYSFLQKIINIFRSKESFKNVSKEEYKTFVKSDNSVYSHVEKKIFTVSPRKILRFFLFWYPSLYKNLGLNRGVLVDIDFKYIIFESTLGLFHFDRLKKLYPDAYMVYRVSDDLRFVNNNPDLIRQELKILPLFDLVSVPTSYMLESYKSYYSANNLKLNFHGVNKKQINSNHSSPFTTTNKTFSFIGTSDFDYTFLKYASDLFPKYHFHVIGPIVPKEYKSNIFYHGEIPFMETFKFIQYSDVCLSNRSYSKGAEMLADSNKILQYTFASKPIIVPDFIATSRENTFSYIPGDTKSIKDSILAALEFSTKPFPQKLRNVIKSWEELTSELLNV